MGRPFKHHQRVIDTCSFDHAAVERDVAHQHRQPALLRERVFIGADAAFSPVHIQTGPARGLAERDLAGLARRASFVELLQFSRRVAHDVPLLQCVLHGWCVDRRHVGVQLASAVQLAQDGHDAACAVHVFNMVLGRVGCHLAELGHDP